MKLKDILLILPPLLSVFILMSATGFFLVFMPLRLDVQNAPPFTIGIITASYYFGLALGAFRNPSLILRIGHIRAFAVLASLVTAVTLLNGIFDATWQWILFRAIVGYCLAGLYICIESWILKVSKIEIRGASLALYMVALYGAYACGQFFLDLSGVQGLLPFVIVAVLSSLSIIPLALTKIGAPIFEKPSAINILLLFKLSPSGLLSCTCAGMLFSSIIGFLPLYLEVETEAIADVAFLMFLLLLGGMSLQYPIGRLSDQFDRRKVIASLCLLVTLLSLLLLVFPKNHIIVLGSLIFVLGGASFAIYPVGVSYTCDRLEADDIMAAIQGLMLSYSAGAILGPLLAPLFVNVFGLKGLFIMLIVLCGTLGTFIVKRLSVAVAPTEEEQLRHIQIPHTTPIVAELDPRAESRSKNVEK